MRVNFLYDLYIIKLIFNPTTMNKTRDMKFLLKFNIGSKLRVWP